LKPAKITGFSTVPPITQQNKSQQTGAILNATAIHGGQVGLITHQQTDEGSNRKSGRICTCSAKGRSEKQFDGGGGKKKKHNFEHGMHRGRLTGAGGAGAASGKVAGRGDLGRREAEPAG
jgi:hypothetical protein